MPEASRTSMGGRRHFGPQNSDHSNRNLPDRWEPYPKYVSPSQAKRGSIYGYSNYDPSVAMARMSHYGLMDPIRSGTGYMPSAMGSAITVQRYHRPPRRLLRADFKPGMVIWSAHFASLNNQNVPGTDKTRVETHLGPCSVKGRYMVVLQVFHDNLIAIPAYTFGGQGIINKPPFKRHEYIGFKNCDNKDFVNDCPYPPIECTNLHGWAGPSPKCVLNLAETVTINYTFSSTVIKGNVTKQSYKTLVALYVHLIQGDVGGGKEAKDPGSLKQ